METAIVYRPKERMTIIGDKGHDYLVRDEEGVEYLIDKSLFRRRYEPTTVDEEGVPPNTGLWEELHKRAESYYHLQRINGNLHRQLKNERQENDKLRRQLGMKRKPHYRNGRKRGSRGHNG